MATKKSKTKKPSAIAGPEQITLGKWLRQLRLKRGIALPKVAAETHIQLGILRAIEADQYRGLPHNVHTLGFVRRYAKFLGQDMAKAATSYRELRGPLPRASGHLRKQRVSGPIATSRLFVVGLISVGLVIVGIYLVWQIKVLTTAPSLSISAPSDNQVLNSTNIEVAGQTTPGAEVIVNGQPQLVDSSGHFRTTLSLPSGVNTITVKAQNKRNKTTRLERSVLVQLPSQGQ